VLGAFALSNAAFSGGDGGMSILEDQFQAFQTAQQSQFQATQAAIAALQASLQTSATTQNSTMHDLAVQVGNQSNEIAAMTAQIQYRQAQSDGHRR
jgi:hypothetical protein